MSLKRIATAVSLLLGLGAAHAQSLNSPTTNKWFANEGVSELRWGDRVFVGDAATHYPNTPACPTGDWFTTFEATTSNGACGYIGAFQAIIESHASNPNASSGLLAAGQTKNAPYGAFGLMGFALNNNPATTGDAWGGYFECNQTVNGRSGCIGVEIDNGNMVNNAYAGTPDPFQQSPIVDLQLACGSGLTWPATFQCGAAIQTAANNQAFKVGVSILSGSIATQTLFGIPLSQAIVMPVNHAVIWYSAAGAPLGGMTIDSNGNLLLAGPGHLFFNGAVVK